MADATEQTQREILSVLHEIRDALGYMEGVLGNIEANTQQK